MQPTAVSWMKVNRQDIHAHRQAGANSERWKRLGWWLAVGLPITVALGVALADNLYPPDVSEDYDVSSICLLWSGGFLVAVGLAMAVAAVGRGGRAWKEAQNRSGDSDPQAQLGQAYEIRLRSAWMIIAAIGISALGACIVWLSTGG